MTTTPHVPAPLAPDWAFVVQLREGSSFDSGALCGRVEHVASGKAGNFASLEDLRRIMRDVLSPRPASPAGVPTSDHDANGAH